MSPCSLRVSSLCSPDWFSTTSEDLAVTQGRRAARCSQHGLYVSGPCRLCRRHCERRHPSTVQGSPSASARRAAQRTCSCPASSPSCPDACCLRTRLLSLFVSMDATPSMAQVTFQREVTTTLKLQPGDGHRSPAATGATSLLGRRMGIGLAGRVPCHVTGA